MTQGRFDWRTLLGVLLALAIGLVLTLSTFSSVRAYHRSELELELTERGRLLAATVTGLDVAQARGVVERLDGELPDVAAELFGADGQVLHASDKVVVGARGRQPAPRSSPLVRRVSGTEEPWVQAAVPVPSGGWVAVARPLSTAEARSASLEARVLRLTIPIGVTGIALGLLWVLRVNRAIREVTEFVAGIIRGGAGRRLPTRGSGTIGDLSRSVNRMAWEIESHDLAVEREMAHRRAVLASMDDGVVAVDDEQLVLAVNRTVLEQLKFTEPQPEGQHLWEVTRQKEALELVERCLAERRRLRKRIEVPAISGSRALSLELRASPIVDTQGGGCVLVVGDRTEIEHLERVRRDFVANVSHELKTPLTSVHGYLETLQEDADLPASMRNRFIEKALKNSDRLIAIVRDLLSLARAESAGASIEFAPVRLVDLAEQVIAATGSLAAESGIEVQLVPVSTASGLASVVLGDRAALALALGNLVENAIKYSPAGTRVAIHVVERGTQVRLIVEDQGPGIPPEHHDRLFERFYRVDKERSRVLGGTGLGLSIVRNVAVVHGGTVGVDSRVGEGSRFWIELPREST
jgi:two-component system phosphate regulon sensor histidine kinase PhoR